MGRCSDYWENVRWADRLMVVPSEKHLFQGDELPAPLGGVARLRWVRTPTIAVVDSRRADYRRPVIYMVSDEYRVEDERAAYVQNNNREGR